MIKSLVSKLSVLLFFVCWSFTATAAPSVDQGKQLFTAKCATCHAKNMKDKLTGPALSGVEDRWADKKDLFGWIRNSQAMLGKGNKRAVEVWNDFKPTVMTNFPELKDEEIESILMFIKNPEPPKGAGGGAKDSNASAGKSDTETSWWYYILFGVLGLLAFVLARLIANLNQVAEAKEGNVVPSKTWSQILTSKTVVGFVIFALIVLGGYTTVNNAISMGRQQGYAPSQPIKFSHATHAGENKIDCQYCHDAARRSKHSGIPGTNTCMNCHAAIKKGSKYGTQEITKIYASIGFDPSTGRYVENYDNLDENQVSAIYKKWIGDTYMETKGTKSLDADGELVVNKQWNEIKSSLTNTTKSKVQGPIEWTRVHNLPDHAYYNHSQHVTVGKLACQQCHGKVEGMEVLTQHAPLSMGWCVNCHRTTEVKFKENKYYDSYETLQKQIKAGTRDKVTVEDIGGVECQKCHY